MAKRAEGALLALKQQGRSTTEYVHEFWRVAGRLRSRLEHLLVHQFRASLDRDLHQACVFRGIPSQLQDWFHVVVDLDAGLQEFRAKGEGPPVPHRAMEKPRDEGRRTQGPGLGSSRPKPRPSFRCFHCNQPGHRVAECLVPITQEAQGAPGKAGAIPKKTPERLGVAHQVEGPTP
ncbi:Retrotransposon-derived protein PEG10 [Crotalus adamanteus]|uniref:Retrotransposon-derived protein PEG10 n=1 Tax=Crotalus adamanteus TaxID=8729 RepID=A0AAW1B0L5_CROAD